MCNYDHMSGQIERRMIAELIGTALAVTFGAGSIVAAVEVGQWTADYGGLGMIFLAFGVIAAIVIYAFGATSDAHISPTVTVSLAAVRRFSDTTGTSIGIRNGVRP